MSVSSFNRLHAKLIVKLTEKCWSVKPNSIVSSNSNSNNEFQNSKCIEYLSMTADAANIPITFSIGPIKVTPCIHLSVNIILKLY